MPHANGTVCDRSSVRTEREQREKRAQAKFSLGVLGRFRDGAVRVLELGAYD